MRRSLLARLRRVLVSIALTAGAVAASATTVLADSGGGPFP